MQKIDFTTINVINCTNDCRILPVPQMINIKRITDLFNTVFDIKAGGTIRIRLFSNRFSDFIGDVFDKS